MSAIHLLNTLKEVNGFTSDYQLARYLGVNVPNISKMRKYATDGVTYSGGKYGVSGDFILAVYDRDGMSIERIRELVAL